MQTITLTKGLLTELSRCDRAFIMSLFHHGLDNDSLAHKEGLEADSSTVWETRREMMYNLHGIADSIAKARGVTTVDCNDMDIYDKVRKTWNLICSGDTVAIVDGALEGAGLIVGVSLLIVRDDGMWEVYHQSTKSYDLSTAVSYHKVLTSATADAAPLMYVLANAYHEQISKFAVIAANKKYLTPYPDPLTGDISVDPNDAMLSIQLDIFDDLTEYMGNEDPMQHIGELQNALSANPFWIPEPPFSFPRDFPQSCCNKPYHCPYYSYCERIAEGEAPTSVSFFLPSRDASNLKKNGYYTMDEFLELSYEYPTLEDIPGKNGGTFKISEAGVRELWAYEQHLDDLESNTDISQTSELIGE